MDCVAQGVAHFNAGRFPQARRCFRRALERDAGDKIARCFLAHALEAMGRRKEALREFSLLRAYVPGLMGAAGVLRRQGRLKAAKTAVRSALRRSPRHLPAWRALVEILRSQALDSKDADRISEAGRFWRELLNLDPKHAEARREVALARRLASEMLNKRMGDHETVGHWREAEKAARRLLKGVPRSIPAYLTLSASLRHRGDAAGADAALKRARRLDPERIAVREERFKALMKLGCFRKAFKVAEEILDSGSALHPNRIFWNPWERYPLEAGKPSMLRTLNRLVESGPSPWALYYRAALRGGDEALEDLDLLSDCDQSRYGWMSIRAGVSYLNSSRFQEAAKKLRLALRVKPVEWKTHCYLAEALLCLGRPGDCLREFNRAQAAAPKKEEADVLAWRGAIQLWRGLYDEAFRLLDRACASGAQHAFCWRGAAKFKQGHPREALKYLDETIEKFPVDLEAYVWRGEAHRELGMLQKSLRDLDRAPQFVWARWNRALVKCRLGDEEGMKSDFRSLPPDMVDYVRDRPGFKEAGITQLLEAGLRLGRGFRRNDYGQAVWMV